MLNGSRHYPRELGGTTAGCARLPTPYRLPQPGCGFRGTERGSIPLPVDSSHSRFGTVFRQTYRQALTGLSWLSYSQPSHFSTVPGLVGPVSPVTRLKAPHAGQVERSETTDLDPLYGITQSENCLTHFDRWRPCSVKLNKVIPHRPHSGKRTEARDQSARWELSPEKSKGRHSHFSGPHPETSCLSNRIECRDYSEATGFCQTRAACRSGIRISPTSLRRAQRTPLDVPRSTGQPRHEW